MGNKAPPIGKWETPFFSEVKSGNYAHDHYTRMWETFSRYVLPLLTGRQVRVVVIMMNQEHNARMKRTYDPNKFPVDRYPTNEAVTAECFFCSWEMVKDEPAYKGTTRQSLSRDIGKLKNLGVIECVVDGGNKNCLRGRYEMAVYKFSDKWQRVIEQKQ